jgi:hypothetical protein
MLGGVGSLLVLREAGMGIRSGVKKARFSLKRTNMQSQAFSPSLQCH